MSLSDEDFKPKKSKLRHENRDAKDRDAEDTASAKARSEMTLDDQSQARKRSNTIASISDDGNQEKYRSEVKGKIEANKA